MRSLEGLKRQALDWASRTDSWDVAELAHQGATASASIWKEVEVGSTAEPLSSVAGAEILNSAIVTTASG